MALPALVLTATLTLSPTHLALAFESTPELPRAVLDAAVSEAAAIWAPYRVEIDRTARGAAASAASIVLQVVTAPSSAFTPGPPVGPLGAISFAGDGTPNTVITVFLELLREFAASAHIGQMPSDVWPSEIRDRIIGRALGRVIAHEIGHYLLRSREHSVTGLMRAVQPPDDLFAFPRNGFFLGRSEVRRLGERSHQESS